ncbi:cellulose binding domain-containing protein [Acrocarpospora pleiomorpha]|uniref:cellulose binding domain-containing protein n=1 Tax=Acrocarpospora pleiomorpha TaxID=90975 RepID=UPI001FE9B30E|nr:cellulose binding domain-containing protein [Acrocarpospora pleiomorpha]
MTFTLPAGHTVTGWNAIFTQSGQTVTARNTSSDGNLGLGASTTFGQWKRLATVWLHLHVSLIGFPSRVWLFESRPRRILGLSYGNVRE